MIWRLVTTVLTLLLAPHVRADLLRVEARDVSEDVGTPAGLRTWALYAVFDDPADGGHAVSGDARRPLVFETNAPMGIVNEGGLFAGLKQEDLPHFVGLVTAEWDSFFAMTLVGCGCDAGSAEPDVSCDWDYSPLFLDSDAEHAVLVDGMKSFVEDGDAGWWRVIPAECGEVLIARFTIEAGYGVRLAGVLNWWDEGDLMESPFCVASADFALCAGDVDGDGDVAFADLLMILTAWGPCAPPCPADLDGSGVVDHADLTVVLATWGHCPAVAGACCLPDGTCFELDCTSGLACTDLGGVFLGANSDCSGSCP